MDLYCSLIGKNKRELWTELALSKKKNSEQITSFLLRFETRQLLTDQNLFLMSAHFEGSCLFMVVFRSLKSFLISWTLKPETQASLIKGNTLLCSSATHPLHVPAYMLFSEIFFY